MEPKDWKSKSPFPYWELPKNKTLEQKAKELRKAGVLSEVIFWNTFKDKEKIGWDIDRQVIIRNYIVDFLIPELGLIFEIDGSTHDFKYEYDLARNNFLESLGLSVIHIKDTDVLQRIENVKDLVVNSINDREKYLKERM